MMQRTTDLSYFPEKNPNPVIEVLLSGELVYCNAAARQTFPDITDKKLGHPVFTTVLALLNKNSNAPASELKAVCEVDGKTFDQKVYFTANTGSILVYCNDISEQKRVEEDLERLALFPIQNPNPVFEVDILTGEITFKNPAAKKMFPHLVEAEPKHPLFSEIVKRLGKKEDFATEILVEEKYYEQKIFFIPQTDFVRIYLHDLTEIKRTQKNLSRLASFPEQNPNPIVELDTTGNITYTNAACQLIFPDILSLRYEHPVLSAFQPYFEKFASGEMKDMVHEITVGKHFYIQRVRLMVELGLIRIFNTDITSQKEAEEIIREKNKDITDSINYAQRIQRSFLPSESELNVALEDYFVLFLPKDIVSGDFYWSSTVVSRINTEAEEKVSLIAAVDCTGHGVPGALMSIVGNTLLNQTIKNPDVNSPAEALDFLNRELPKNLKGTAVDGDVKDGMDMTMIAFSREKMRLYFAGAMNPAYIISDGKLTEVKGDKQPISGSNTYGKKPFTHQKFDLKKGDMVYLFTDGYADQFGGPKGKKFKYKQLQDVLLSVYLSDPATQKEKLKETFMEWKGSLEQVDDVLLIGVRI